MATDLISQIVELRKWLTGAYGPLPRGIAPLIKPTEFESAALMTLADGALPARARMLLAESHRVIRELIVGHPSETRLINSLLTYSSSLSDMLQKLETSGGGRG